MKFGKDKIPVIWFTGLPGAGKTTIGSKLRDELRRRGETVLLLDGDDLRSTLNRDLDFTEQGRKENIRRASEVSMLLHRNGIIALCSFITPTESIRKIVRDIVPEDVLIEVYISTPLEICEKRDSKGLYRKVREGKIKEFTGIDAPFEIPINPDYVLDTSNISLEDSITSLLEFLKQKN